MVINAKRWDVNSNILVFGVQSEINHADTAILVGIAIVAILTHLEQIMKKILGNTKWKVFYVYEIVLLIDFKIES
jgi:hypothetical protein